MRRGSDTHFLRDDFEGASRPGERRILLGVCGNLGQTHCAGFSYAGDATVAERTCDLYTNTMGITGLNVTYQLYIDQETGACLGWTEEKETGILTLRSLRALSCAANFRRKMWLSPFQSRNLKRS